MEEIEQKLHNQLYLEINHYKRYQDALLALKSQMLLCEERIWNLKKEIEIRQRKKITVTQASSPKKLDPWKILGIEQEEWDEFLRLKGAQNGKISKTETPTPISSSV